MIDQGELFVIPNPCQGICTSNNRGFCLGCLRSRDERFYWHEFTPFQQQLIANLCEKRRLKILASKLSAEQVLDEDIDDELDIQPDLFQVSTDVIESSELTDIVKPSKKTPPLDTKSALSANASMFSINDDIKSSEQSNYQELASKLEKKTTLKENKNAAKKEEKNGMVASTDHTREDEAAINKPSKPDSDKAAKSSHPKPSQIKQNDDQFDLF
ncbi:MAG: DUF1289 domain-containing protein [Oleibacter sp.]|nr:DUF1289 domain-containing protein [Thalassolituus sp.]